MKILCEKPDLGVGTEKRSLEWLRGQCLYHFAGEEWAALASSLCTAQVLGSFLWACVSCSGTWDEAQTHTSPFLKGCLRTNVSCCGAL